MAKQQEEIPNQITLRDIPEEVWDMIRQKKIEIMTNNKQRVSVSHQEAIYKLITKAK